MKGLILEKGFKYYTHLDLVLLPIKKHIEQYNWLITDCECNYYPDSRIGNEYDWVTGNELLEIVSKHDIKFIWGVLSAFSKEIELDEILSHEFPYADGYTGFWENPISIQHPLAVIEIVPWDSSLMLIISKYTNVIDEFKSAFPLCEDLEKYNTRE